MEDYHHRQFYSLGVGSGTAPQRSLCAVSNEGRDINEGWLERETSFMLGRLDLGLPGWGELVIEVRRGWALCVDSQHEKGPQQE